MDRTQSFWPEMSSTDLTHMQVNYSNKQTRCGSGGSQALPGILIKQGDFPLPLSPQFAPVAAPKQFNKPRNSKNE